jgi:RHS repeat-associated protein
VHSDGVGQVTDYADLETGLSRHLVWDAEGHLSTQVLTPAPALGQPASTWAYRYNARDQRVAKVAVGGPVAPTAYLWGAGGLLRESGASTTDYVHGAGMILAAGGTRLAHDHLGSPIASLAENALNPETGTFDGWGRYFSGAAPNADGGSAPTTHVGYTGHAYDADSDLTYAEARWYDPDIGAFLSRDPVAGMLSEPGTLEPFGYVRGNPLFYVDPDGRVSDEALDAQSEYRTRRHKEMEALRAAKAAARGALFARIPGRLSDRVRNRVVLTLDRVLNDASLADANSLAANPEPTAAAAVGHWSDVEKRALQATDKAADVFLAHWALYTQEGQEGLMQVGKVTTVGPLVVAAPIIAPAATAAAGAAASGHSVYEDVKSGHVGLGTVVNAVVTVAAAAGLVVKAAGLVGKASGAGKAAAPVRVGEASEGGMKLLPPGTPGSVVPNRLLPHEAAFAQEIVDFQGGTFVGAVEKSLPGIDGRLSGVPVSLKETTGGLGAVLRHASKAEASALNAGVSGVELFVKAPNVRATELLDFARSGPLSQTPSQGTISGISVFTKDGVVRIVGGQMTRGAP